MIKEVRESEFIDDMTEEGYGFSYYGALALFNYLCEMEEGMGEPIEYDPYSFRCEYTEYDDVVEAAEEYGWTEADEYVDEDEKEEAAYDYLNYRFFCIKIDGGGVIVSG